MFSSIPPVIENNEGLNMMSRRINIWLQAWCHQQGFVFFDLGLIYVRPGLLTTDRISLFHRQKRVLGWELAGFIVRALNSV